MRAHFPTCDFQQPCLEGKTAKFMPCHGSIQTAQLSPDTTWQCSRFKIIFVCMTTFTAHHRVYAQPAMWHAAVAADSAVADSQSLFFSLHVAPRVCAPGPARGRRDAAVAAASRLIYALRRRLIYACSPSESSPSESGLLSVGVRLFCRSRQERACRSRERAGPPCAGRRRVKRRRREPPMRCPPRRGGVCGEPRRARVVRGGAPSAERGGGDPSPAAFARPPGCRAWRAASCSSSRAPGRLGGYPPTPTHMHAYMPQAPAHAQLRFPVAASRFRPGPLCVCFHSMRALMHTDVAPARTRKENRDFLRENGRTKAERHMARAGIP